MARRNEIMFAFVLAAACTGGISDVAGISLGLTTSRAQMVQTEWIMH